MLIRILFLTLVSLALFRSFSAVQNLAPPSRNYFEALAVKESNLRSQLKSGSIEEASGKEELADILWQKGNGAGAENIMRQRWIESSASNSVSYNERFVQVALRLARIYLDDGDYSNATYCYNSLLDYERGHLGKSNWHIARDLNNLGIASYMASQAEPNSQKRAQFLKDALHYYSQAAATYAKCAGDPSKPGGLESVLLANNLFANRELQRLEQPSF